MLKFENNSEYNCIVLLGPTAVGKTSLGVSLASHYGLEIISADSRQTYVGLDLGSGKDIEEYSFERKEDDGSVRKVNIPYHMIDIVTLDEEYNVFKYQNDFYSLFRTMEKENKLPFVVGGTGMYVDSIVRGYDFVPVPENEEFRRRSESMSLEELGAMLLKLRPNLHNKSDLLLRDRVVRAIEIELFMASGECEKLRATMEKRPEINAFVIGTTVPREQLRANITKRLRERIDAGMIEEVENLHRSGFSWERLEKLGLEYRYVSCYLEGKISTKEEMFSRLNTAIGQFAKRQETWFRGMEKKGAIINWLPPVSEKQTRLDSAIGLIDAAFNL